MPLAFGPPKRCAAVRDCSGSVTLPASAAHQPATQTTPRSNTRPLKLSMNPFSTGRPGRMKHNCTFFPITHASNARLQNSVPLSTVRLAGKCPRSAFALSSACATCIPSSRGRLPNRPLPCELIHHRQNAQRTTVGQLVAHKVHAPTLVRRGGRRHGSTLTPIDLSSLFGTHDQLLLAV